MDKVQYDAAAFRLKRLIKSIFRDKQIRIDIDDYHDAVKTECIVEMFSIISVVVSGAVTRAQLMEMSWYGCNLGLLRAMYYHSTGDAASRLYFDCRQFINDLNSNRI